MKRFTLLALLVLALGLLAACAGSEPAPQPAATQVPCPECAACPEAASCPEPVACPEAQACPEPVVANVPFEARQSTSSSVPQLPISVQPMSTGNTAISAARSMMP